MGQRFIFMIGVLVVTIYMIGRTDGEAAEFERGKKEEDG